MHLLLRLLPLVALNCCGQPPPNGSAQLPERTASGSLAASRPAPQHRTREGMFALDAVSVWERVAGSRDSFTLLSPDGRSRLVARWIEATREGVDEPVLIDISGAVGRRRLRLVPGIGTEILWSPRSDALAISTSGGGLNGIYRLIVLRRVRGRLEERDVTGLVTARFGQAVRCDWPEPPNVAAITWLPNGNVVAAAEIVHHTVCDSYGTFKAYELDPAAMRIVREFSQSEAKRLFGQHLGWEIADAPDVCERHPQQCTVAYRARRGR